MKTMDLAENEDFIFDQFAKALILKPPYSQYIIFKTNAEVEGLTEAFSENRKLILPPYDTGNEGHPDIILKKAAEKGFIINEPFKKSDLSNPYAHNPITKVAVIVVHQDRSAEN